MPSWNSCARAWGALFCEPQTRSASTHGLVQRCHGASRRLESRQPERARPVAAARVRGTASDRITSTSTRARWPHTPAHRPGARGVCAARRQRHVDWRNRAHFFGAAAQVMRRILVDHARRRTASKRGDGLHRVSMDEATELAAPEGLPVLALDQALDRLATMDQALARIVELRAFGGMTIEEAACVLNVSPSTAKREWRTAKAWLTRELSLELRP
jgi:hypothetical protein